VGHFNETIGKHANKYTAPRITGGGRKSGVPGGEPRPKSRRRSKTVTGRRYRGTWGGRGPKGKEGGVMQK